MRATFMNQLAMGEAETEHYIHYKHPYRVGVEIYICPSEQGERNWALLFRSQGKSVPKVLREALQREFRRYIRQRIKRNINLLTFDDFMDMAGAITIA